MFAYPAFAAAVLAAAAKVPAAAAGLHGLLGSEDLWVDRPVGARRVASGADHFDPI
jgi:hypothetical protein